MRLFVCRGRAAGACWLGCRFDDGWGTLHKRVKDMRVRGALISGRYYSQLCVISFSSDPDGLFVILWPLTNINSIIDIKEALLIEGFLVKDSPSQCYSLGPLDGLRQKQLIAVEVWGGFCPPIIVVNAPLLCNYPLLLNAPFPFSCQPNHQCWEVVF